jgi:hypothetical protein
MQHLPTFAGVAGRLPGGQSQGWLFMKNTILHDEKYNKLTVQV